MPQRYDPSLEQLDAAIAIWRTIAARQVEEVAELAAQGIQDSERITIKKASKPAKKAQKPIPTKTRSNPPRATTAMVATSGPAKKRSTKTMVRNLPIFFRY